MCVCVRARARVDAYVLVHKYLCMCVCVVFRQNSSLVFDVLRSTNCHCCLGDTATAEHFNHGRRKARRHASVKRRKLVHWS